MPRLRLCHAGLVTAGLVLAGSPGAFADQLPAGPVLPTQAERVLLGGEIDERLGTGMGSGGDVDGDKRADLLVGAQQRQADGSTEGVSTLLRGGAGGTAVSLQGIFGPPRGAGVFDTTPSLISTPLTSSVGDVNGDGLTDVAVTRYRRGVGTVSSSGVPVFERVTVLYGKPGAPENLVLGADTPPAIGFDITNVDAGGATAAGDVNRDGIGDILIGMPNASGGESAVAVLYGRPGRTTVAATPLAPVDGFRIVLPDSAGKGIGWAQSRAGDVNGDGFGDVLLGAPFAAGNAGRAYVVLGGAELPAVVTLADQMPVGRGFAILPKPNIGISGLGQVVAAMGDADGDKLADVVVAAPAQGKYMPHVFVIYGRPVAGPVVTDPQTPSSTPMVSGPAVDSISAGQAFGIAVDGAGDVNRDGRADLVIGAPAIGPVAPPRGGAYVIPAPPRGDTWSAFAPNVYQLRNDESTRSLGTTVAGLRDGRVAVGSPDDGGARAGMVHVFSFQSASRPARARLTLAVRAPTAALKLSSGATFALKTSTTATVRMTVYRTGSGQSCMPARIPGLTAASCSTVRTRIGSLTFAGTAAGARPARFSGRLGGKRLTPGSYVGVVYAISSEARSALVPVKFKVAD